MTFRCISTTSKVLTYHPGRSPASFVLCGTTWGWKTWVCAACPVTGHISWSTHTGVKKHHWHIWLEPNKLAVAKHRPTCPTAWPPTPPSKKTALHQTPHGPAPQEGKWDRAQSQQHKQGGRSWSQEGHVNLSFTPTEGTADLTKVINLQEPCILYIRQAYRLPPDIAFYIFFSTNVSTEYFKHAAHSLFFSSKCRLFHNATFFGSCIIHILHTGCAKI